MAVAVGEWFMGDAKDIRLTQGVKAAG